MLGSLHRGATPALDEPLGKGDAERLERGCIEPLDLFEECMLRVLEAELNAPSLCNRCR